MLPRRLGSAWLVVAAVVGCCPPPPAAAPDPPPTCTPTTGPHEAAPAPLATIAAPPTEDADSAPTDAASGIDTADLGGGRGWATFHADAARTGHVDAPTIRRPRVRWKARVGVQSWLNSPIVVGRTVLMPTCGREHNLPDPEDGVVALDLGSGKRRWHGKLDGDANGAAATERHLLVTSDDGHLYALELGTGRRSWKQPGQGKMYTHPLVVGSRVVVGDSAGYVRAFDAETGDPLWQRQLTGPIRGGAAADERAIYVVSQGGEAAALDHATGGEIWRKRVKRKDFDGKRDVPIEAYSVPVLTDRSVIIPFARDTTYPSPAFVALDKRTGSVRWRARGPNGTDWGNLRTTPALVDGILVYGEPYSGDVVGVDAHTGRVTFRQEVGRCTFPQWASAAGAGGTAYVPRFGGTVFAVDAARGTLQWELYIGDSRRIGPPPPAPRNRCSWDVPNGHALYTPAAVAPDGTLLVGSDEGYLYAIENR